MTPPTSKDADDRSFISIREVLELLVEEFPDATVSKIRFLESRGLIRPERTPSGYRKFYDADVERLRWILRQQREHFLPLKVIKGRLEQNGAILESEGSPQSLFEAASATSTSSAANSELVTARVSRDASGVIETDLIVSDGQDATTASPTSVFERSKEEAPPQKEPSREHRPSVPDALGENDYREETPGRTRSEPRTEHRVGAPAPGETPRGQRTSTREASIAGTASHERTSTLSGASLSLDEFTRALDADPGLVADLEEYGLIVGREIAGVTCYDEQALVIARIAAGFRRFGIEARHLRTFKHAAEREAGLFAQVVNPLLRQRNPQARERAQSELKELAELGAALQDAFIRAELESLSGG